MSVLLFAMIGAKLGMGVPYWLCFGLYCVGRILRGIIEATDE